MAVPQKIENTIIIQSNNSISGYIPKRIESRDSKRIVYSSNMHGSIHNSQRQKQPKWPSTDCGKR